MNLEEDDGTLNSVASTALSGWRMALDTGLAAIGLQNDTCRLYGSPSDVENLLVSGRNSVVWPHCADPIPSVDEPEPLSPIIAEGLANTLQLRTTQFHAPCNNDCWRYLTASPPHRIRNHLDNASEALELPFSDGTGNDFLDMVDSTRVINRIILVVPNHVPCPDALVICYKANLPPSTSDSIRRWKVSIEAVSYKDAHRMVTTFFSLPMGGQGVWHWEDSPFDSEDTPLVSPAQKETLSSKVWHVAISHGLALQMRWDFAILTDARDLRTTIASKLAQLWYSYEYSVESVTRSGAFQRYSPVAPTNKRSRKKWQIQGNATYQIPDVAFAAMAFLPELVIGLPGVSDRWAMIRQKPEEGGPPLKDIRQASQFLESIEQHQEGGRVQVPRWLQAIAILWVVFSAVVSLATGIGDFGNRNNVFEQISDSVSVATTMLVSIFGLVKLTSEDRNAIRNTLLGYKVIRRMEDLQSSFRWKFPNIEIGSALGMAHETLHWLADTNTCYMIERPVGALLYTRGVSVTDLRECGIIIGDRVTLDYEHGRSLMNTTNLAARRIHMDQPMTTADLEAFNSEVHVGRILDYTVA